MMFDQIEEVLSLARATPRKIATCDHALPDNPRGQWTCRWTTSKLIIYLPGCRLVRPACWTTCALAEHDLTGPTR